MQPTFVAQDVGKAAAFDVLHDDERSTIFFTLVEDSHDVLVVQTGNDLGLALEPRNELSVLRELFVQDLDSDGTVQQGVTS